MMVRRQAVGQTGSRKAYSRARPVAPARPLVMAFGLIMGAKHMPDTDEKILSLFRDWIDAQRARQNIKSDDEEEHQAAFDATWAIAHTIANMPSAGPAGLIVKAY